MPRQRNLTDAQLQEQADKLFACCLQFLIGKEECFLLQIHNLSKCLLDEGYETTFQHKRKILVIRAMFQKVVEDAAVQQGLDQLLPRPTDLEELPNG